MVLKINNEKFICDSCKSQKLKQMNVLMSVGGLPALYGTCQECNLMGKELYYYKEETNTVVK